MATGGAPGSSASVKSRPRCSRMPSAVRVPGDTSAYCTSAPGTRAGARAPGAGSTLTPGPGAAPSGKGTTLFSTEERLSFIDEATAHLPNVRSTSFDVLIVEFAESLGARAIVKGLRAISDFEYEMEMNQLNRMQAPDIDTLYLMASPQYSFLSSSGVKELAMFDGKIDDLVPERVARRLKEELAR